MANETDTMNEQAKILIRLPHEVRRKLKIIAAYENSSMNEKVLNYIKKGIEYDSSNVEDLILDNI